MAEAGWNAGKDIGKSLTVTAGGFMTGFLAPIAIVAAVGDASHNDGEIMRGIADMLSNSGSVDSSNRKEDDKRQNAQLQA